MRSIFFLKKGLASTLSLLFYQPWPINGELPSSTRSSLSFSLWYEAKNASTREEDDTRCSRLLAYFTSYNLPEENGELLLV